jgi:hypothetical protein
MPAVPGASWSRAPDAARRRDDGWSDVAHTAQVLAFSSFKALQLGQGFMVTRVSV